MKRASKGTPMSLAHSEARASALLSLTRENEPKDWSQMCKPTTKICQPHPVEYCPSPTRIWQTLLHIFLDLEARRVSIDGGCSLCSCNFDRIEASARHSRPFGIMIGSMRVSPFRSGSWTYWSLTLGHDTISKSTDLGVEEVGQTKRRSEHSWILKCMF